MLHGLSTEWRQSKGMIGLLTSFRGAIAVKEVQVQAMRSFATSENPDMVMAEQELATMRAQLSVCSHSQPQRRQEQVCRD